MIGKGLNERYRIMDQIKQAPPTPRPGGRLTPSTHRETYTDKVIAFFARSLG